MLVTRPRRNRRIFFGLVVLLLFVSAIWPGAAGGNDDQGNERHRIRPERGIENHDNEGQKSPRLKRGDDGNALTGQTAAWLLAAANMTVVLSMLMKGAGRYFRLQPETRSVIKRFNQFQKKHLMRFHYVLNPAALGIAGLHFLLSSCGKSSLPEWGLLMVAIMVLLGAMVKFKIAPKWMRGVICRLHASPAVFSAWILVLVAGHLIMD